MIEQTSKPNSQRPLYEQVKEQLLAKIDEGTYLPLAQLPSEHELSEQFNVSRITIRQALHRLSQEGVIFKVHGKGTFVSKPKAYQNISQLQGFAEAMSHRFPLLTRHFRFGQEANGLESWHSFVSNQIPYL